jgi:hypothetical protein
MSSPTVCISERSNKTLRELAEQTGKTVQEILDQAVEDYRRKVFFQGLAADYAALKADPEAWAEELAERKLWETTLMDGLDPSERWTEDGRPLPDEGEPK